MEETEVLQGTENINILRTVRENTVSIKQKRNAFKKIQTRKKHSDIENKTQEISQKVGQGD